MMSAVSFTETRLPGQYYDSETGLNYVVQRSYENEFGFLDYRTFTGHVNATYEPNIEGLKNTRLSFKVGQNG